MDGHMQLSTQDEVSNQVGGKSFIAAIHSVAGFTFQVQH